MLNISFQETLVILVVTVLIVKPSDLPKIAHTIGKMSQKLRLAYIRFTDDLLGHYESESKKSQSKRNVK